VTFEAAITALASKPASERSGRLAVVERIGRRGEMTPVHMHPEDEIVHVVEGAVTLVVDGERIELRVGDVYAAPPRTPHALVVESHRARYVSATVVRSAARYEDFLRAVAVPVPASAAAWDENGDAARLAAIAEPNGIEILDGPHAVSS
jgi:quercetin dioxygenase-like cupin family protein